MQDQVIRKILIEYLQIQHPGCRVYQEKVIGNAVCDVLLVTNKLIGFEIKSDTDTYARLPRQIQAYQQFFEENYIVIGTSHLRSAETKVPVSWGILEVAEAGIRVVRKSGKNTSVRREKQLSMLWALELNNLLLKNKLPLYPGKRKEFLADTLCRNVSPVHLGPQIAEELRLREESNSAENQPDLLPMFPAEELIDRLSEEDLSQLTLDQWLSLYRRAAERQQQKKQQVLQLETAWKTSENTNHKTPYTDIRVTLGVPWVSAEIVSQFAMEVLRVPQQRHYEYDHAAQKYRPGKPIPLVRYEKITGYWHVEKCRNRKTPELTVRYGTRRFNAMQILECTLNLRPIKIYDGSRYNEPETIAALE